MSQLVLHLGATLPLLAQKERCQLSGLSTHFGIADDHVNSQRAQNGQPSLCEAVIRLGKPKCLSQLSLQ
jgi:hypothetical protein